MPGFGRDILVDFEAIKTELLCSICNLILREAVVSTCGHRYCESCVKEKLSEGQRRCSSCPTDSTEAIWNEKEIHPDFCARKELKNLACKCRNKGCQWRGTFHKYVDHCKQCLACMLPRIENQRASLVGRAPKQVQQVDKLQDQVKKISEELEEMEILHSVQEAKTQILEGVIAVLSKQIEEYMNRVQTLEIHNQGLCDTIREQQRQIQAQEQMLTVKGIQLAEHELRIQALETPADQGVLIWKISEFSRRRRDAVSGKVTSFYSPAFYTSRFGYKMCARIYLNGNKMGEHTHVSLYFIVMKGRFDNILSWPFRQKVTFVIYNQEGGEHHVDSFRPDPLSLAFIKPVVDMNIASGCPCFIAISHLESGSPFVKDNCLFVKVAIDVSQLAI